LFNLGIAEEEQPRKQQKRKLDPVVPDLEAAAATPVVASQASVVPASPSDLAELLGLKLKQLKSLFEQGVYDEKQYNAAVHFLLKQ